MLLADCRGLREPEVEQLDLAVWRDANVRGLQVAVNHARFVCGFKARSDLQADIERFVQRQRPALQTIFERFTRHKLEREKIRDAVLIDAVNLRDVRVIQTCERLGFALETFQALWVRGEVLGQDFDRHVAIQTRVARSIHLAHRARAEWSADLVERERLAG